MTNENETPSVSDNVRAEVARDGRTQTLIADQANIPPSTWARRMALPGTWRWDELVRVAYVLHVPVQRLTGAGA